MKKKQKKEKKEEKIEGEVKVLPLTALDDDRLVDMFLMLQANVDSHGPYLCSGYGIYQELGREIQRRLLRKEIKKALSED